MAETASTLATWRVGGQIDESALTGIPQLADITVVATLIGAAGQNVVDPSNKAHDLRGPYTTIVGGVPGTATTKPSADGNATLSGRLWWTEPLKPTGAALPANALQPSGLAWQIDVTAADRRGDTHQLASFVVAIEGDRNYTTALETILVPSGAGGADEAAVNVTFLVTPPATVVNNTFDGRVLSALTANGVPTTREIPVAGTTGQALVKASGTNYDVAWSTIAGGGGTGEGLGSINAADYGVDPAKWFIWDGGSGPGTMTAADSTADFQAAFNAVAATHVNKQGGTSLKFPKGRYLLVGTVTVPDMVGAGGYLIDMTDVEIIHKPLDGVTGVPMFKTAEPSSNAVIQALNDSRSLWTWRGGYYDGDGLAGQVGFLWNVNARMLMERVKIRGFDTGIHCRFTLHFKLRDSMISSCSTYGVRVEAEAGAWTGITPASSASNGSVFENVRFYGVSQGIAQLRVVSSAHTVRECTFEGAGPSQYNYQYVNNNTSCLTSKLENCWFENDPGIAHVLVDTMHQFELDFQYTNTSAFFFDAHRCSLLKVHHLPWPSLNASTGTPRFKVNSVDAAGVIVAFDYSGNAGLLPIGGAPNLWANGVFPGVVSSFGFDTNGRPQWECSGRGGNVAASAMIWKLSPPGAADGANGVAVAGTLAAVWERTF